MELRWFGHSFFELVINTDVQKNVKVYFDPYSEEIGLTPPKNLSADIVLISHQHYDHNNLDIFSQRGLVIDTAGEYSCKGVDVRGIKTFHDTQNGTEKGVNIVFIVESEGLRMAHLGDLGHLLSESQMKEIDGVDILMVPVGGPASITGKDSVKVIRQIEPKLVIPMHYKIPGINFALADLESFCSEIGVCPTEPTEKLNVKAGGLMGKEMEVVVMRRAG